MNHFFIEIITRVLRCKSTGDYIFRACPFSPFNTFWEGLTVLWQHVVLLLLLLICYSIPLGFQNLFVIFASQKCLILLQLSYKICDNLQSALFCGKLLKLQAEESCLKLLPVKRHMQLLSLIAVLTFSEWERNRDAAGGVLWWYHMTRLAPELQKVWSFWKISDYSEYHGVCLKLCSKVLWVFWHSVSVVLL